VIAAAHSLAQVHPKSGQATFAPRELLAREKGGTSFDSWIGTADKDQTASPRAQKRLTENREPFVLVLWML